MNNLKPSAQAHTHTHTHTHIYIHNIHTLSLSHTHTYTHTHLHEADMKFELDWIRSHCVSTTFNPNFLTLVHVRSKSLKLEWMGKVQRGLQSCKR